MSTLGTKIEATGDLASDKAKQGKHAIKQMQAEGQRKMDTQIAKDPNMPAGERIKAAGGAVKEGVKEVVEGGMKKVHETKGEHDKNKIAGKY